MKSLLDEHPGKQDSQPPQKKTNPEEAEHINPTIMDYDPIFFCELLFLQEVFDPHDNRTMTWASTFGRRFRLTLKEALPEEKRIQEMDEETLRAVIHIIARHIREVIELSTDEEKDKPNEQKEIASALKQRIPELERLKKTFYGMAA